MNLQNPLLTVVCPAYNEEGAIRETVREVVECIGAIVPNFELLVMNDGSRDRTGQLLDELAATQPALRVVHQSNAGHGPSIRRGMEQARGEWIFLIDSDRQMSLAHFHKLWAAAQTVDGVFAFRHNRDDPTIRLLLTRVVSFVVQVCFGRQLKDLNVPYKLLRKDVWLRCRSYIPENTLAPSLFLSIICQRKRIMIRQLPVPHRPRTTGVISIRRWKLFKFCAKGFGQLCGLWLALLRR